MSDCYDVGDPKDDSFTGLDVCVFCGCPGSHYDGCQVAPR